MPNLRSHPKIVANGAVQDSQPESLHRGPCHAPPIAQAVPELTCHFDAISCSSGFEKPRSLVQLLVACVFVFLLKCSSVAGRVEIKM